MATTLTRPRQEVAPAERRRQISGTNVGEWERLGSAVAGGALAVWGLSRFSLWGLGLAAVGSSLVYRGATGHCSVYKSLGINTAEQPHGSRAVIAAGRGVKIERSVTINRSPEECYRFWRRLENLPRFMKHLDSVKETSDKRSTWVACEPLGIRVEWEAEIINERAPDVIAWRSLPESDIQTAGSVHFTKAPADRGTMVQVSLKYDFPGGKAGSALARLFGKHPDDQVREDLRRFKQLVETGEIATIEGQPRGQ